MASVAYRYTGPRRSLPPHLNPNLSPTERQIQLNKYIAERLSPYAPPQQPIVLSSLSTSGSVLAMSCSGNVASASTQNPLLPQTTQQQQPLRTDFGPDQFPNTEHDNYLAWLRKWQRLQFARQAQLEVPWYLWAIAMVDILAGIGGITTTSISKLILQNCVRF